MAPDIDGLIAAIREDRVRGAAELGRRAAEVLMAAAGGPLDDVAEQLVSAQPAMATIWNVCRVAATAQKSGADAVIAACRDFVTRMDRATAGIARRAAGLIPPHSVILTHSASEAVFQTLQYAREHGGGFRVIATESRPGAEGLAFAERLRSGGIATDVVVDTMMARAMRAADLAMVGADSVNASEVVNKVGTCLLALAARHSGKPAYVLCPSTKLWDRTAPPAELFEATPRRLFTGIVTEQETLGA